jgi:hypothetical protein
MTQRRTAIEAAKEAAMAVSFLLRVEKWSEITSRPGYYEPYETFSPPEMPKNGGPKIGL